jgi:hypothetical protein
VSYTDDDDVDWGTELSLLLDDDCMAAPEVRNSMPVRAAAAAEPAAAGGSGATAEKKDEPLR